ncbi:hypothetical protein [Caballeronia sp. KNU42]
MPYPDVSELNDDLVWLFNEANGKYLKGSGRLIADNLILTAAHILFDDKTPILHGWEAYRQSDWPNGRQKSAWPSRRCDEVVWRGTDCIPDVALLRIESSEAPAWRPRLRLRVATLRSSSTLRVESRGYPRASLELGVGRSLVGALGDLRAITPTDPLIFSLNFSDVPKYPRDVWKGMSGSPVFLHDSPSKKEIWVFGVVQEVPGNFDGQFRVGRLADAWNLDDVRTILVTAGVADFDAEEPYTSAHHRRIERSREYHRATVEADAQLRAGLLLPALDLLVKSFSSSWDPEDGWLAWERLAYRLSNSMVTAPIEVAEPIANLPVSLDVSTDDGLLAIGCRDGVTFVQHLRLPVSLDGSDLSEPIGTSDPIYLAYYPFGLRIGLSGARLKLVSQRCSSRDEVIKVRFLPGAVLHTPLEVRRLPLGGGAHFAISHVGPKNYFDSPSVDDGVFAYDWPFQVSLSARGKLRLHKEGADSKEIQLDLRTREDAWIGVEILKKLTVGIEHEISVACVSREGRYYHLDADCVTLLERNWREPVDFLDLSMHSEVVSFSSRDSMLLVMTKMEIFLIRYDQIDRIAAYEGGRITAAALLGSTECCLGYEDGSIETFEISSHSFARFSRFDRAHYGAIVELKPCWPEESWRSASKFLSIGADGVVQIWPIKTDGPSHVVLSTRADIRTACFVENGKKLTTAHSSGELMLWDISKPTGKWLAEDVLEIGPPELEADARTFVVKDKALYVGAGMKYAGWHLTRTEHHPVTHGQLREVQNRQQVYGRACWATDRSSILVFQDDPEYDRGTRLLPDIVLIRLDSAGRARLSHPKLLPKAPSAYACSGSKAEFAIFYSDGSFVLFDARKSEILFQGDLADPDFKPKNKFAATWCSFTPDRKFLVALVSIRPRLLLISMTDSWLYSFDEGTKEEMNFILGPVVFSACGERMYVGCGDGSVVAIRIRPTPPEVCARYKPFGLRYQRHFGSGVTTLDVSPNGQFIAAGLANSCFIWTNDPRGVGRQHERDEEIAQLKFASNDRLVVIGKSGRCATISALTGKELYSPPVKVCTRTPLRWITGDSTMLVRLDEQETRPLMGLSVFSSPYELYDHLRTLRRRLKDFA